MRQLRIHISALNDAEYTLFTTSLSDLAFPDEPHAVYDDTIYESMSVGVREARAWLRGRYSRVPASDINSVTAWSVTHRLRR
jgi:hypothetical protein